MKQPIAQLKWFWRINYGLTLYKILALAYGIFSASEFVLENHWFNAINQIITLDGAAFIFSYIVEWMQFPICLLIIIIFKTERTILHLGYLVLLILSCLMTFVFYAMLLGSLGGR